MMTRRRIVRSTQCSFRRAVYVLHVFQKKSTKGIATPKAHMALVSRRLVDAQRHYNHHYGRLGTLKEQQNA